MSSISPRPLRSSTRMRITARMSSFDSVTAPVSSLLPDAAVELHAAHGRQVVALFREEQAVEQRLDRVFRGRLARAHHAVDGDARRDLVGGLVDAQGLRNVRALVEVVGVDGLDARGLGFLQLGQHRLGDLVVGVGQDLAGLGIDDVVREHAPEQVLVGHGDFLHARGFHVADVLDGDALVLRHDDLAGLVHDVEAGDLAAQALRAPARTRCPSW